LQENNLLWKSKIIELKRKSEAMAFSFGGPSLLDPNNHKKSDSLSLKSMEDEDEEDQSN